MDLNDARIILIDNFKNNPDCLLDEQSSRALIMDSIPELCAEKNILIVLYHAGLVDEIKNSNDPFILKNKYKLILTKEFGYSERISLWCIETWLLIVLGLSFDEISEDNINYDNSDKNKAIVVAKSEYERLLEEISNLKALITSLTAERDELQFHECRDLAAEYNRKIGELELKVLNAKLNVLRLKRMIEILQSQINRQERKSEKKAKEQANQEYKKFEDNLNRKSEEARNANQYKEEEEQKEEEWEKESEAQDESEQEKTDDSKSDKKRRYKSRTDEMKALYRKIVKALHPDMNPDETDVEKEMFNEAVDAYNKGNLSKLREIAALIDEGKIKETPYSVSKEDIEKLKEIIEGLKLRVEELISEIENIKNTFPYNMKEFLSNETAVSERQSELQTMLKEYEELEEELEKRFSQMLGK